MKFPVSLFAASEALSELLSEVTTEIPIFFVFLIPVALLYSFDHVRDVSGCFSSFAQCFLCFFDVSAQ